MVEQKKVYTDDRLVHYQNSKIPPKETEHKITTLLTDYGLKNVRWEHEGLRHTVCFDAEYKGKLSTIRKDCPRIYDHDDTVNWIVSMRNFYWPLKATLEDAYLRQISMVEAFLANVVDSKGLMVKDKVLPQLEQGYHNIQVDREQK
jgi:hypothetical protein